MCSQSFRIFPILYMKLFYCQRANYMHDYSITTNSTYQFSISRLDEFLVIYMYINFQLNHPTIKYTYLRSKVSLETVRVTWILTTYWSDFRLNMFWTAQFSETCRFPDFSNSSWKRIELERFSVTRIFDCACSKLFSFLIVRAAS